MRQLARLKTLMPAGRRYRLGRAYEGQRRWDKAEQTYRAILESNGADPQALFRLGRVLERQHRWAEAADAYRSGLAIEERNKWLMRLGKVLERSSRAEAREVYEKLLERDPKTTELDRRLLKADSKRFPSRRRYVRFVGRHLDDIRERAAGFRTDPSTGSPKIWMYWAQGIEEAPPVVQLCQEQLQRFHSPEELIVLDEGSLDDFAEIPGIVRDRLAKNPTKLADVLRFELLVRYGGVWLDATCYPRERILDRLPELLPSGFFAFRYRRARISSWMLVGEPAHPVLALTLAAQHVYWERFRRAIDYYVVHHLFEALYYLADDFRELVIATPWRSSHPPARFARRMLEPYDAALYKRLLDGSFVHKLSYKYPAGAATPDTLLGHLMRGEEPCQEGSAK